MRIIPAIDILNGQCVRLSQGDYNSVKVYNENPLDIAQSLVSHGVKHLHLVDLDGAKSSSVINLNVLETIASQTNLKIDFGGGIKSDRDIEDVFNAGADQVSIGSVAVKNSDLFECWLNRFGAEKINLGADCFDRRVASNGWLDSDGVDVLDFITTYEKKGVINVICTDISKDGMLNGPAFGLYGEILDETGVKLTASGGIRNVSDVEKLRDKGCDGVIIGKAIYEGLISLKELQMLC